MTRCRSSRTSPLDSASCPSETRRHTQPAGLFGGFKGWTALSVFTLAIAWTVVFAQQRTVPVDEPNRGGEISLDTTDPEVAIRHLFPAEDFEVNLFASEQDFPIANPVSLTFDDEGRLWVVTMPTYPQLLPGRAPTDKLVILEDTDGDGKADRHTVFADELYLPTGFELGDGGAYVAQQPNLMFLQDTTGDGVADRREIILHGFGTEDSHHSISAFTWGPGGGLYMNEGTFHHSQVETPWGPVRLKYAGVFRYEPSTWKLRVFVSYPFANPWGHVFDRWGQSFVADASGGANYWATAFSHSLDYPEKMPRMREFTPSRVRPTSGCEIVSSRHFPDHLQGNFLLNNTIGFHGIKQHRIIEEDSGFTAEEVEPLLYSTDINFRPVDLQFGPDGALYVVDWFNPLVGHMQYSVRDSRRDHSHGRIWRITYRHKPLLKPIDITRLGTDEVLNLLKEYEDRTRYRARRALRSRDREEVSTALGHWLKNLDAGHPDYEHHLLEGLWVHQHLNEVNEGLLRKLLKARDYRARAAATRVVRYWKDGLERPLEILEDRVLDTHPRVRLEAVVALTDFRTAAAAEIALRAAEKPMDYYLDYGLGQTVVSLERFWKPLLIAGRPLAGDNAAGLRYLLDRLSAEELLGMEPVPAVLEALLERPGLDGERRTEILVELSRVRGSSPGAELLGALERMEEAESPVLEELSSVLASWDLGELAELKSRLEDLAFGTDASTLRRGALAALVRLAGSPDTVWNRVADRPSAKSDLFASVGSIPERDLRDAFFPYVREGLASSADDLPADGRRAAVEALGHMPGTAEEALPLLLASLRETELLEPGVKTVVRFLDREWSPENRRLLAEGLLAGGGDVPYPERNQEPFLSLVQAVTELTATLPADVATPLRRHLESLKVLSLVVTAVPDEMRFDVTRFEVVAGRPVEIVLENPDSMPHNLLIVVPGTLEEVSLEAEEMARLPDAFARAFVPDNPNVLYATPLLNSGENARIHFIAPADPGDYPFVCTFPGHWRTMNGIMRVLPARTTP